MGVQEVRWDKGGTARARDFTFFYGKGNENHQLGTGFFVHQRMVPAVKKVAFVSDRILYVVLRSRWCNIIVLNAYAPTEERLAEHVACMGERRSAYRTSVGKPDGRRPLGRPRHRWGIILKWIYPAQDRHRWRALLNTVMNLRAP